MSDDVTPNTPFSTESGGKQVETVDNSADDDADDPVRAALANAQRMARGRGRPRRRARARGATSDAPRGGYSGPAPDGTDPQPIGAVLRGFAEDRGWQRPLAEARVFAEWSAIVGSDVAAHCAPVSLRAGELRIAAESTAWATQLRLLSATLLERLVNELGPSIVTRLAITGPVVPSWKHGRFSVPGARGPRDTYG
jgi:predicted nucleic acid-binding Zn ribbon protein